MTSRSSAHECATASGGFTLLEMVVVLAVLGLALVLVTGYRPPWSRGYSLDATGAELAAQLRLARSEAITSNRPVVLALDLARHRYRVGTASPQLLPPAISLQLVTTAGERQTATTGDIGFNPDGSSTGGRIVLVEGKRRLAVGVDWLTGRVSIADVR
jgi:general secretion pathway protein H